MRALTHRLATPPVHETMIRVFLRKEPASINEKLERAIRIAAIGTPSSEAQRRTELKIFIILFYGTLGPTRSTTSYVVKHCGNPGGVARY
jgi:hypothetical protein